MPQNLAPPVRAPHGGDTGSSAFLLDLEIFASSGPYARTFPLVSPDHRRAASQESPAICRATHGRRLAHAPDLNIHHPAGEFP
jgi:hypothetical protein